MKKVTVLGAGLVAGPLVKYLLDYDEIRLTVADIEEEKARQLIKDHPRGRAVKIDLQDRKSLKELISGSEVVVSLVPYTFHPYVADLCLEIGCNLVTASYVSPEMKALDHLAREKDLIFLNEVGLDPGIDHMEAKRLINSAESQGGKVVSFISYCGGLPAPEANDNPFGYKFSWSPRGVLLAGRNEARYLKDGQEVVIPAEELFSHYQQVEISGLGVFEGYPNRNSIIYKEIYKIPQVKTMFRGTLRYPGWCLKMKKIGELGLLDINEREWKSRTYADFIRELLKIAPEEPLIEKVAAKLQLSPDSEVIKSFDWLGLFSDRRLPANRISPLDLLASLMVEKLKYKEGERDLSVLYHEIIVEYRNGKKEKIISSLIDFGIPYGPTSMSRLVGLPAAIATRLILEGRIKLRGVLIPTYPEIYEPILEELKTLGVSFREEKNFI
ncbi:MAG: saccharopine dehydrogenase C-terminal domain-containing protein [Candidatus Saccharicenans sp.]|nr:MAG: saccharopine dehydrogenase [Candidatus Aminicenantes bacterium]HEK86690.1 saccharopine dehydrogenase [Candidatus Aminicenantes bacterium]